MTLGCHPARGRFVGTFICSWMRHLWLRAGALDAGLLTLDGKGPSCTGEAGMAKYRHTLQLRGDGQRVHTSSHQRADSGWHRFMTTEYRRRAPASAAP